MQTYAAYVWTFYNVCLLHYSDTKYFNTIHWYNIVKFLQILENLSTNFGLFSKLEIRTRRTVSSVCIHPLGPWSCCDLDLWPLDAKHWSTHPCPKMHKHQKFGESQSSNFQDVAQWCSGKFGAGGTLGDLGVEPPAGSRGRARGRGVRGRSWKLFCFWISQGRGQFSSHLKIS